MSQKQEMAEYKAKCTSFVLVLVRPKREGDRFYELIEQDYATSFSYTDKKYGNVRERRHIFSQMVCSNSFHNAKRVQCWRIARLECLKIVPIKGPTRVNSSTLLH